MSETERARLDTWLRRIERQHPREIELGLDRIEVVLRALAVERPAPIVITVGGTNGKGSCVAFLAAILSRAGLRVGTYTSPHLIHFNERICLQGQPVEDAFIVESFERVAAASSGVSLTYFEFSTAAAMELMSRAGIDAAVLEVGLGGRLDAVNAVASDVAIVTSVGIDHEEWLGSDRESIGREKAGIFRAGRVGVCGDPEPPSSLASEAARIGATLRRLGKEFELDAQDVSWSWRGVERHLDGLPLPRLQGAFQLRNAACALAAIEALGHALAVPEAAARAGLESARLPGRFQIVPGAPTWILDVAHNPEAARAVAAELAERATTGRTVAVIGMLADKQVEEVAHALEAQVDVWLAAATPPPRGLSDQELAGRLRHALHAEVLPAGDVASACSAALERAAAGDRILVCGSFHTVGPALAWLDAHPHGEPVAARA